MPESLTWRRVPRVGYAYTLAAIIFGLLLAAAAVWVWCQTLPPLERYYTWTYLRLVAGALRNEFEADHGLDTGSPGRGAPAWTILWFGTSSIVRPSMMPSNSFNSSAVGSLAGQVRFARRQKEWGRPHVSSESPQSDPVPDSRRQEGK
jgi:hypothetical protein